MTPYRIDRKAVYQMKNIVLYYNVTYHFFPKLGVFSRIDTAL